MSEDDQTEPADPTDTPETEEPPRVETPAAAGSPVLAVFREGITGIIALVVVVVTFLLMLVTFGSAADFDGQKDILLVAVGLLGSVMGYYFGRVPAERRADEATTAKDEAVTARERAEDETATERRAREEAERKVRDALDTIPDALDGLEAVASGAGAAERRRPGTRSRRGAGATSAEEGGPTIGDHRRSDRELEARVRLQDLYRRLR